MDTFLQLVISGMMVGAVYGLLALGFVLIYKSSGILNLAQGELLMFGALLCWQFLVPFNLPIWLSFVLTFIASGFLGMIVEHLFLRPMIAQPILAVVMMTIALSLLLRGVGTFIWPSNYAFTEIFPSEPVVIGRLFFSQQLVWMSAIAVISVGFFIFYFRRTKAGLAMRAVAEDQEAAQSVGVRVGTIFATSWVIAAVVSAIAGVLLGTNMLLSTGLSSLGLIALPVVLLGGMDSIPGAIIAGLVIGITENLCTSYLDPIIVGVIPGGGLRGVAPFLIMMVVLFIRPYGLFGSHRIERI